MQDFTGVPAIVDLATMREAMRDLGGDPPKINPLAPAELVIDHSVIADVFGTPDAFARNVELEYQRNRERYQFLRWGQGAFDDFKVVPPGTGIVHQVNIEYLARVVVSSRATAPAYPDTLVGTDSHTTMVNGLGVLGWGVGGIEAEAAMLGQPVSMLIPRVVGFKLTGELPEGSTATDLVLTITELLRQHGVVGKFVEFYGPGVGGGARGQPGHDRQHEPGVRLAPARSSRSTTETLRYLRLTGATARSRSRWSRRTRRSRASGTTRTREPAYSEHLELDLSTVVPSLAGPKRPQDRVPLTEAKSAFRGRARATTSTPTAARAAVRRGASPSRSRPSTRSAGHGARRRPPAPQAAAPAGPRGPGVQPDHAVHARGRRRDRARPRRRRDRRDHLVHQHLQPVGDDRRALLAKNAVERGLQRQALGEDLARAGLQGRHGLLRAGRADAVPGQARLQPGRLRLHHLHRQLRAAAGAVSDAVNEADLAVVSVLSGNRNFEGRINPDVKMNYLASPPLVVAYALAGSMDVDLTTEPLGTGLGRRAGLPARHLAVGGRGRGGHRRARSPARCSPATTPTCSPATSAGSRCRPRPATRSPGTPSRPTCASRRTSTAWTASRRRSPTSPAPGCSPSSATR